MEKHLIFGEFLLHGNVTSTSGGRSMLAGGGTAGAGIVALSVPFIGDRSLGRAKLIPEFDRFKVKGDISGGFVRLEATLDEDIGLAVVRDDFVVREQRGEDEEKARDTTLCSFEETLDFHDALSFSDGGSHLTMGEMPVAAGKNEAIACGAPA